MIDITAPLGPDTAPFPGDAPFVREWTMTMAAGEPCNVSKLAMSPHVGTHADAPYHYERGGATMEAADLDLYMGPARVIRVRPQERLITVDALRDHDLAGVVRLLVRTDSYLDHTRFHVDFAAFEPTAVDYLAKRGIRLIGVDTPSVDLAESKELPAHGRCRAHNIYILETLRLQEVDSGDYELIAFPLRLQGSDASPVRAVLRMLR